MDLDESDFSRLVDTLRSSIVSGPRRVGLRLHRSCVSGKDVTSWLRARRLIPLSEGKEEALKVIGQRLIDRKVLAPIASKTADVVLEDSESVLFTLLAVEDNGRMSSRGMSARGFSRNGASTKAMPARGFSARGATSRDVSVSHGLRRSLDLMFPVKKGAKPPRAPNPLSPADSTGTDGGIASSIDEFEGVHSIDEYALESARTEDSKALLRASLDLVLNKDEDSDDEIDGISMDSCSPVGFTAGGVTSPRKYNGGPPSSLGRRMMGDLSRRMELRNNTLRNRSTKSVLQTLQNLEGAEFNYPDAPQRTAIPLLSSQFINPSLINSQYSSCSISFNENVHVKNLDEEGNLIETLRVPIDYSIKRKLQEPKPDPSCLANSQNDGALPDGGLSLLA